MKKILLLTSAFLAAVACSREPVAPEEPVTEHVGPIQVTLVTGEPETRTELGYAGNKLKPFWSTDDNINIIRIPNSDESEEYEMDEYEDYVFHLFESGLTQASLSAVFTGEVDNGGQYRAFYPDRVEGVDRWGDPVIDGPMLDEEFNALRFTIPTVQYPSSTSFDKRADLLVSAPFEIPNSGSNTLGAAASDIPISFTRPNAIVKVVFNVSGSLRNKLENQKVRRVSFNSFGNGMGPEGGEMMMSAPQTRAFVLDNDEDEVGLTGDVLYGIPYVAPSETYNCNETDSYQFHPWMGSDSFVFAEYTDETAFDILDSDAAVYFVVYPSILKNEEYEGTYYGGLPIRIETDGYVITRDVRLPSSGIALQPSVVTTLNIRLSNDNSEVTEKGISFDNNETTLIPGDGEFVDLKANEIYFPRNTIESAEDFEEYFTVSAPDGISIGYVAWGEIEGHGTEVGDEGDCISDLYLSVDDVDPGDYEVTITYEGYSATCTVHVLDKESLTDEDFITFADQTVKGICVDAWGGRIRTGELSKYEASKVTSLNNPSTFKSYFLNNTVITSFDELQYFTGLRIIGQNAFKGCSSLQSVIIPEGVTGIHSEDGGNSYAFQGCTSLTSVSLPESLERIGFKAFYGCTSLEEITLPASVLSISGDAFRGCTGLHSVVISSGSQLESLYGDYYNSATESGEHGAFYGCTSLASINLPPSLKTIGPYVFKNCIALESIDIPASVKSIGNNAFDGCTNLESISIPAGITSINAYTFRNCELLSRVSLPEGLTIIDRFAFYHCKALHEIEFPASLATIGYWYYTENYVFDGVEFRSGADGDGVTYHGVKFKGSTPPTFEKPNTKIKGKHWDASINDWVDGVVIYVPTGSKDAYLAVSNINPDVENRESFFIEY